MAKPIETRCRGGEHTSLSWRRNRRSLCDHCSQPTREPHYPRGHGPRCQIAQTCLAGCGGEPNSG